MSSWQPIRPEHAIEVMAAVVTLREPLPSLVQRRAFKATEDIAFSLGLRSRHVLADQAVPFPGLNPGIALPAPPNAATGYLFNAMAEEDPNADTGRPPHAVEQIEVRQTAITYRTWNYVSWKWNSDRVRHLFAQFIAASQDISQIGNIRLEYLDRFFYDGDISTIEYDSLLRPSSRYISPHVYDQPSAWHSHAGLVVPGRDDVQRVMQVHLDTADAVFGDRTLRSVGVMTSLEDRVGLDAPVLDADMVTSTLNEMHEKLKHALSEVISGDLVERIHLQG